MYVVAGVTGQTGRSVAQQLVQTGKAVTGLTSRDPAQVEAPKGVALRQVDLRDADALAGLAAESEGFYGLIPPLWSPEDYEAAVEPLRQGIIAAAKAAPRSVVLSSIAAQRAEGTGPIRSLHPLEAALRDAPGVTLLRASYFLENLRNYQEAFTQGVLPTYWSPERAIEWVDTRTIGKRAAELLTAENPGSLVQLSGERPASFEEVAQSLGQVLSQDIRAVSLPAEAVIEPLQAMGAGQIAELYAEMNRAMDAGEIAFEDDVPVERRGPSLKEALARVFA
ncbi:MAG: NAD(P)H-binding protein [Myxococcota bacterium]